MRNAVYTLLGFPAVWLLSALLHTIDPDMNGVSGLAAPGVLLSVTAIAFFLFLPALLPLFAFHLQGGRGYGAALLLASGAVGVVIAALGSSATNVGGWLLSFFGVTLICGGVFLLATLPAVLALRQQRQGSPA